MTDWGAAPRTAFAVRLCIAEIVTNAIEHGAAGDGGDMTVTLLPVDSAVNVEIRDAGRPFDPTQVADAPIPLVDRDGAGGGLGNEAGPGVCRPDRLSPRGGVQSPQPAHLWRFGLSLAASDGRNCGLPVRSTDLGCLRTWAAYRLGMPTDLDCFLCGACAPA